jgi:hypothetical protein
VHVLFDYLLYQQNLKRTVSRRGQPEAFAGRVHLTKTRMVEYPISSELLDCDVLDENSRNVAYVEVFPTNPKKNLRTRGIRTQVHTSKKNPYPDLSIFPGDTSKRHFT